MQGAAARHNKGDILKHGRAPAKGTPRKFCSVPWGKVSTIVLPSNLIKLRYLIFVLRWHSLQLW